jgi:hypothetical protein
MKEFSLCFCLIVGLCVGLYSGKEYGAAAERQAIANDCRYGQSFTLRRTGFYCEPMKK